MAYKTTLWHPDTCGCSINMQFDSEKPMEPPKLHFAKHCEIHKGEDDAYKVLEENQRKNKAMNLIARHFNVEPLYLSFDRKGTTFIFKIRGMKLDVYEKNIINKKLVVAELDSEVVEWE